MRESGSELRRVEIIQHANAQDQIVLLAESHAVERVDRAEPDVAARAESADDVLARVHARVLDAWAEAAQRCEPVPLSATNVEHSLDRAPHDVFSDAHDERGLSRKLLRRFHAVAGVA